ncbi:MAG: hypothetical protein WCQ96_05570 [Patescibacteria group bacterium]
MKETDVSGLRPGQVIDADAVQAANNMIRNRPLRDIIIAKEQVIVK